MARSSPHRAFGRRLRSLAAAVVLAASGLIAVAGPVHAATEQQITGPAEPVPVNTSYTYSITASTTEFLSEVDRVRLDLSGAAATVTDVSGLPFGWECEGLGGSNLDCFSTSAQGVANLALTATVLPTETGIVDANAVFTDLLGNREASTTTTIAPAAPQGSDLKAEIAESADPVSLGDTYTYSATVTNNGPANATGATAEVALSGAAHTIVSASPSQGSCSIAGSTTTCALGALADSAQATVTVTVEPGATGTITAQATADATESDPSPENNTDTESTTINNGHGCTIIGTPGDDTLHGGNGDDVICGLGGNDTLKGGNGADTIWAGTGDDTVDGGNDNDNLHGGDGNDIMGGGNGADYLYGEAGNDKNYGETLLGSLLYLFDNGDDHIYGGPGNDELDGQKGNDILIDKSGTDTMKGSVGNDNIDLQDGTGGDTADGGLGNDTCTTDAGDTRTSC